VEQRKAAVVAAAAPPVRLDRSPKRAALALALDPDAPVMPVATAMPLRSVCAAEDEGGFDGGTDIDEDLPA